MRIPILRFGIVALGDGTLAREHLATVCGSLGYVLGTTVSGYQAPNHRTLVTMLERNELDLAWLPPVIAMDSDAAGVAYPLLAMVRQGETSYHAVLFSRRDSGIRTLADIKDLRAAWVSPESASGYLVPLAILRARGIGIKRAFRTHTFVGSHGAVARHVLAGDADVGSTFGHFVSPACRVIRSSGWTEEGLDGEFHIVAFSGPIPTDVISTHASLRGEQADILAAAFQATMRRPEAAAARALFTCEELKAYTTSHLSGLSKLVRMVDRPRPE